MFKSFAVSCPGFRGVISVCAAVALWLGSGVAALAENLPQKFGLADGTLVYDTETGVVGEPDEISEEDVERMRRILADHPEITQLQLNSAGGSVDAGEALAELVLSRGLHTLVDGICVSACVDVFLAGNQRRMTPGSRIGFHQRSWPPEAVHSFYRSERKAERWSTPFEFGSWIYSDTQREIHDYLTYMVMRGVDPAFAIETLRTPSQAEWYPSRLRLTAAGVLRELPASQ
ncbi:ATP-dependent Clp protease proteolytic subunit [Nocardioides marinus]|nr:ATP-dependent Clp protease proteolytic subunit [Nocardioides marinus]